MDVVRVLHNNFVVFAETVPVSYILVAAFSCVGAWFYALSCAVFVRWPREGTGGRISETYGDKICCSGVTSAVGASQSIQIQVLGV